MAASYHERLKDIAKLRLAATQDPRWPEAEQPAQFTAEFLQKIGISYQSNPAGRGYIKLYYQDFIVEEITEKGELVTVYPDAFEAPQLDAPTPADPEKRLRLEAELVKQGMSTFEAVERLAEALQLPLNQITYGGLKDGKALTAQRISINQTTREQLAAVKVPNALFKRAHYRIGMRNVGELMGNRFTILVRTDSINSAALEEKLISIKTHGFYNFFSLQRFGSRLTSHQIGKQILIGNYNEALQLFLVGKSPHESRLLQHYRSLAADQWGSWEKMLMTFGEFPYFFQNEILALKAIQQTAGQATAGLTAVQDQIKMCVNAYHSYCFNRVLSTLLTNDDMLEALPLLNPNSVEWYKQFLPEENLSAIRWQHPGLRFFGQIRERAIPTKTTVTLHSVTPMAEGQLFHFDLNKGAYATTFLAEVFALYQGKPVPAWVNQQEIDTRSTLGYPSLESVRQALPIESLNEATELD